MKKVLYYITLGILTLVLIVSANAALLRSVEKSNPVTPENVVPLFSGNLEVFSVDFEKGTAPIIVLKDISSEWEDELLSTAAAKSFKSEIDLYNTTFSGGDIVRNLYAFNVKRKSTLPSAGRLVKVQVYQDCTYMTFSKRTIFAYKEDTVCTCLCDIEYTEGREMPLIGPMERFFDWFIRPS
jgi:hypothetical protein